MFPFAGIFLKIHTCDIVPICYKCWKFSFDGSKFKGTLYVDQCNFLLASWLPLEGFQSTPGTTWAFTEYFLILVAITLILREIYVKTNVCFFAFIFAPIGGICVNINFKDLTRVPYNVMNFALIFQ
jgi:hypothetical protein